MSKKSSKRWIVRVKDLKNPLPINIYAAKSFPILGSKSAANKAISSNRLLINGDPAKITDWANNGDKIILKGSGVKKIKKIDFHLEIVFEDDFIIAINKPGGIAVNGNRNKTVENALADKNINNKNSDALPHPVACHRIDVPTNGIVLLAKTKKALVGLNKLFQNNQVKKEYVAVVHGKTAEKGRISLPIQGKKAITEFETLHHTASKMFEYLSLVKLVPITGRTHQLRIHMQQERHLVVGDKMYAGRQKTILGKGMMLCAQRISFEHPISKETIKLQIPYPDKFKRIMDREKTIFKGQKKKKRR